MQGAWCGLGPAHWSALTHKRVAVHAHNGHELLPASILLLLCPPVSSCVPLHPTAGPDSCLCAGPSEDSSLDLDRTRTRLLEWIRLNRVPVETRGAGLAVAGGVVTVNPPFRVQDCVGLNQVVLDRIQRLIQNQSRDQDQSQDQDQDLDQDRDSPRSDP
uniref:AD domain-containing protein n=1 Tax=Periophthalmus magnuspinnatus TaxID=409849 RepID=A0A3B3Z932_9GOBI